MSYLYEAIEFEGETIIKRSDGAWIPLDPANSDYAEYLRYTEWVEAGNNPEDFWDRSDDLNETFVSEETLPSEEETKIETDLGE